MKKNIPGMLSFILCIMPVYFLHAQPCGVNARLELSTSSGNNLVFTPYQLTLQTNWKAYQYFWYVNGSLFYQSALPLAVGPELKAGFNQVCLNIFATDTLTNDSCMFEYCNIYQSRGFNVFPEFEYTVIGQDVYFSGSYYGGAGSPTPQIQYDFGDGFLSNSLNTSHSYASPGSYSVSLTVTEFDASFNVYTATTFREVQVNNGNSNMTVSTPAVSTLNCDSTVQASVSSTPAFANAYGMIVGANSNGSQLMQNGVNQVFSSGVPGNVMFRAQVVDINAGSYIDKYAPVILGGSCNIIPDTIYGRVFEDYDLDGIQDAGEPGVPNIEVGVSPYYGYFNTQLNDLYYGRSSANGDYKVLVPHAACYVKIANMPNGYALTLPTNNDYVVNFSSGTGHYNYNFGIAPLNTTISGNLYSDFNQDGTYNAGSELLLNGTVYAINQSNGNVFTTYANNGFYSLKLHGGNYTLKPDYQIIDNATVTPDSITVNAPSGGTFSNRNFGYYASPGINLQAMLSVSVEIRPGFNYSVHGSVFNTGFDSCNSTVVFNFDPQAGNILSISPANGVIDLINHTVTWTSGMLRSTRSFGFNVNFNLPASVPIGTVLAYSVSALPFAGCTDLDTLNNSFSDTRTVIGSFDPNDKLVSPKGYGAAGEVHHNQRLYYRINFQNTGTASALNVFVQDEIDPDLDLSTFRMERASHNYQMSIHGRTITWKFININLPDSNTNEPLSHGYVEFTILPVQGLPDGTVIENSADIYFDFNLPVATNSVINTLQTNITSSGPLNLVSMANVYPVPANEKVTLQLPFAISRNMEVRLIDVYGRRIAVPVEMDAQFANRMQLDIKHTAAGVYIGSVRTDTNHASFRLVKQ